MPTYKVSVPRITTDWVEMIVEDKNPELAQFQAIKKFNLGDYTETPNSNLDIQFETQNIHAQELK